jgi:hypothetical protein
MPRFHRFPADSLRGSRVDLASLYGDSHLERATTLAMAAVRNPAPASSPARSVVLTPQQRQARSKARDEGRSEVLQIAKLLNEQNAADRLAEFLRRGLTLTEIKAELAAGGTRPTSAEAAVRRALNSIDADAMWAGALDKARSGAWIR